MEWNISVTGSGGIDREEVRRFLRLFVDPNVSHEVRALPSGRSVTISGDDLDGAAQAVEAIAGAKGTYLTLNPVRPDLNGAARAADVVARRHLLIDCDPARPDPDSSATDAEKAAAKAVADAAQADLTARGWPRPIVVDSGNGWHLLYRIDLPADKLSHQILSRCLKALQESHGTTAAQIDTKVHNASRITKLPGTWARKGPHTDDRPHRMARIVSVPKAITPVPIEALRDLAGLGPGSTAEAHQPPGPPAWTIPVRDASIGMDAYVQRAIEGECGAVAKAPNGERNNRLNVAAFNLGTLLHLGAVPRPEIERALLFAAWQAGLGEGESVATVRSGLDAGAENPRQAQPWRDKPRGTEPPPPTRPLERLTIRASEITPKKVDWLWRDRVPIGFITLFAGRTGLGKSFVTCDFAARLTQGEDLPDGPSGLGGECQNVLFISEDPYEYVLAPRLLELGADMDRVSFLTWEAMTSYTLSDTEFLERAWREAGEPVLIAIDPPTNFLGDADEHKNSEVRAILMHLVLWIASKHAACVLITHVNKAQSKGVDALSRVIGSVAWTTVVRVVHLFAQDPDDPERRLFCPDKTNLGRRAETLAYSVRKTDALATIDWHGTVDLTSDQALSGEKRKPRRIVASDWLVERFREQREWPSNDLFRAAAQEGLSRDAVFEGKKVLDLPRARKEIQPNGDVCWIWWVPPDWPRLAQEGPG